MNKEPPDKIYTCLKIPLKMIIRHDYEHKIILENVDKCNKIIIYALQFIKLYCLHQYKETKTLPKINKLFIKCVLKILCLEHNVDQSDEQTKELKIILKQFYNDHFKQLNVDIHIDSKGLPTVMEYLVIQIYTSFENNIKMHYYDYVRKFVNSFFDRKNKLNYFRSLNETKKNRQKHVSIFCKKINNIVHDVLNIDGSKQKSHESYNELINMFKLIVLPNKKVYEKNSIRYDIKCNPMDYFICMFKMTALTETHGGIPYNLFPLRSEIIPKHIRIDSTTVINLLMETDKSYYLRNGNLVKLQHEIWDKFFRLDHKVFRKKDYVFDHTIITDGVSCSIQFIKTQYLGKYIPNTKKITKDEQYIDQLDNHHYNKLKSKTIVAIDPNKGDLIYCVDNVIKERNHFRYTQDQRRKETKMKKYRDIQQELKNNKVEGKSIQEWESTLSDFSKKTLDIEKFKEYIKKKNELNNKISDFYRKTIFRKLKLNTYLNTLKSEQKMMNRFKEIYGEPNKATICIGDWCQLHQMKYKEPTKGKGFRDLFRKYGYEVYLVNEYNTSCKCSKCEGKCEKFRIRENPRPWRKGNIMVNGLLCCNTCKVLWNRDENSSNNIYIISYNAINKLARPSYLCRKQTLQPD